MIELVNTNSHGGESILGSHEDSQEKKMLDDTLTESHRLCKESILLEEWLSIHTFEEHPIDAFPLMVLAE